MDKRLMIAFGLGVLLLATLSGCDPLTRERFDMIRVDVSDKLDVQETIGEPTQRVDSQWFFQRPSRHLNVIVDFNERGVTTRKQWIDAAASDWTDTQDPGDTDTRETVRIRTIK